MSIAVSFFYHDGNALHFMVQGMRVAKSAQKQESLVLCGELFDLDFSSESVATKSPRPRMKYQKQNPAEIKMSTKNEYFLLS